MIALDKWVPFFNYFNGFYFNYFLVPKEYKKNCHYDVHIRSPQCANTQLHAYYVWAQHSPIVCLLHFLLKVLFEIKCYLQQLSQTQSIINLISNFYLLIFWKISSIDIDLFGNIDTSYAFKGFTRTMIFGHLVQLVFHSPIGLEFKSISGFATCICCMVPTNDFFSHFHLSN